MSSIKCIECNFFFLTGDVKEIRTDGKVAHQKCLNRVEENNDKDWKCGTCGDNNRQGIRSCQKCFHLVGVISEKDHSIKETTPTWECSLCTFSGNDTSSMNCVMCFAPIGTHPPLVRTKTFDNDDECWSCLVCTLEGNHPSSSHCSCCGCLRGENPPPEMIRQKSVDSPPVPHSLCCENCDMEITSENMFTPVSGDCVKYCRRCVASWIESQIQNGNSITLKCPCNKHSLAYKHFRVCYDFLSPTAKQRYTEANRNQATSEREVMCPECNTPSAAPIGALTYKCPKSDCDTYSYEICVKHNVRLSREKKVGYVPYGLTSGEATSERRCLKCLEEAGNSNIVCDLVLGITDAFCDRCPGCKGYVGEPESFDSCMCLKCNHCPQSFCAFCYKYSSSWSETHTHVRNCPLNPRVNYFVESEDIWRGLMKERRLKISEAIIAPTQHQLSQEELDDVRKRVQLLI